MDYTDSIKLLRECDAGVKMAVTSIDDVVDKVKHSELREILVKSRTEHTKLGDEIHRVLYGEGVEEKEPNPMAKGMSWVKTNWKMTMHEEDATVADLMVDGCDMGIKSLHKYLNQYAASDEEATTLAKRLIETEEELRKALQAYL